MNRENLGVKAIRDEIIAASAELRAVARTEEDEHRIQVANWLDDQFIDVTDRQALFEATRDALALYRGGMGSFQDAGTAESSQAVNRLRAALMRGLGHDEYDG